MSVDNRVFHIGSATKLALQMLSVFTTTDPSVFTTLALQMLSVFTTT